MNETIILAGGCFWCTEAVFKNLKGVIKVTPGYSGGNIPNPSYEEVSSENSGHAECVEIVFDNETISFNSLLEVFFKLHDPTTLNRQGADVGTQYRSAIFYKDEDQKKKSIESIHEYQKQYKDKIVTEVTEFTNFYPAEDYHKEYYFKNKNNPYCRLVIDPKIEKLKKNFGQILKD